ncbi:MAG TPA: heat-inducible transcriptional repressor HrcA [Acidobacteriota bacterium]
MRSVSERNQSAPHPPDRIGQRGQEVLRALVTTFLDRGEPIGSRTLSRSLPFGWSAATIRNTMADLEGMGYVSQPHASAGRVPTDMGYRFYVDRLLELAPLSRNAAHEIDEVLRLADQGMEVLLLNVSHVLSGLSQNLALVVGPSLSQLTLRHLELVRLQRGRYLVLLVAESGVTQQKVIVLDEDLDPEQLQAISRYLCEQFRGLSLAEIRRRLVEALAEDQRHHDQIKRSALRLGAISFDEEPTASLFVEGAGSLVTQPEFADPAIAGELLRAIEHKAQLVRILDACLTAEGFQVKIGTEIESPGMERCSVVSAAYGQAGRVLGSVAVLGPTRMQYAQVISLVSSLARGISLVLEEQRG